MTDFGSMYGMHDSVYWDAANLTSPEMKRMANEMVASFKETWPALKEMAARHQPLVITGRERPENPLFDLELDRQYMDKVIQTALLQDYAKADVKLTYELIKGRDKKEGAPYDTLPLDISFTNSWKEWEEAGVVVEEARLPALEDREKKPDG